MLILLLNLKMQLLIENFETSLITNAVTIVKAQKKCAKKLDRIDICKTTLCNKCTLATAKNSCLLFRFVELIFFCLFIINKRQKKLLFFLSVFQMLKVKNHMHKWLSVCGIYETQNF